MTKVQEAISELKAKVDRIQAAISTLEALDNEPDLPTERARRSGLNGKTPERRKPGRKPGGAKAVPEKKSRATKGAVKKARRTYYVSQSDIVDLLKTAKTPLTRFVIKGLLEDKKNISVTDDVLKDALSKAKGRGVIEEPDPGTFELVKGKA